MHAMVSRLSRGTYRICFLEIFKQILGAVIIVCARHGQWIGPYDNQVRLRAISYRTLSRQFPNLYVLYRSAQIHMYMNAES